LFFLDFITSYSIAEELEKKIREKMNIETTIHVEPIIARKKDKKIISNQH